MENRKPTTAELRREILEQQVADTRRKEAERIREIQKRLKVETAALARRYKG
jgi:hypothetical protein